MELTCASDAGIFFGAYNGYSDGVKTSLSGTQPLSHILYPIACTSSGVAVCGYLPDFSSVGIEVVGDTLQSPAGALLPIPAEIAYIGALADI